MKPARERMEAVRARAKRLEAAINQAMEARREALRNDDDARAKEIDHELIDLKLAKQRCIDAADLLRDVIAQEPQPNQLPNDLKQAEAMLAEKQSYKARVDERRAKSPIHPALGWEESAADAFTYDTVCQEIRTLTAHCKHLRKMAPSSGAIA